MNWNKTHIDPSRNAVHRISAVQVEYSPFSLDIEDPDINLLSTCRKLGVAIVAYSPLGRGFLGGQLRSPNDLHPDDVRRGLPRFSKDNFPKNLELVDFFHKMATRHGVSVSTLVLAWLLHQGEDILPIPGSTNPENICLNAKAVNISLTDDEVAEIRAVVDSASTSGGRYPEGYVYIHE